MALIRIEPGTHRELRHFGLLLGVLIAALFGGLLPWWLEYAVPAWPFAIALPLSVAALLKPALLSRLYIVWMIIGHYMGWLNTQIVLLLMFFLVILPAGLVFRIATRSNQQTGSTYRQPKDKRDPTHMEHPY